jgi:hypothetical protein
MSCLLPMELNSHILSFLLFTEMHKKFFLISKSLNKILKLQDNIKESRIFKERINMLFEDGDIFYEINDKYYDTWKKFNSYKWGNKKLYNLSLNNREFSLTKSWHEGEIVDAYDFVNAWAPARIIKKNYTINNIFDDVNDNITNIIIINYTVRFLGWSNTFDEIIPHKRIRELSTYTVHPHKKFESISRDCSNNMYWTLIKQPCSTIWRMEKIKRNMIDISRNAVVLFTNENSIYTVTKDNVDNVIRCISNASVFLTNTHHNYNYKGRILDF